MTLTGIVIGVVPSFYMWVKGYMDLTNVFGYSIIILAASLIVLYLLNKSIIKQMNRLEIDITAWKDQSALYQDKFAVCDAELNEWKKNCEMLLDTRNELMQEVQNLQEKLRGMRP